MKVTLSSHILDSVSGKSVVGIRCVLFRLNSNETRSAVFDVTADEEGRINESFDVDESSTLKYEFELHSAEYFLKQHVTDENCVDQIVIRFNVLTDKKRYHMPVMLSPHSYSTWWSS